MSLARLLDGRLAGIDSLLHCPHCGGGNLHHDRVVVFNRTAEDSETGLRILIEGTQFLAGSAMRGNPSDRRDGLIVELWCEACSVRSELHLAQHKGLTLIDIYRVPREAPLARACRDLSDGTPF